MREVKRRARATRAVTGGVRIHEHASPLTDTAIPLTDPRTGSRPRGFVVEILPACIQSTRFYVCNLQRIADIVECIEEMKIFI